MSSVMTFCSRPTHRHPGAPHGPTFGGRSQSQTVSLREQTIQVTAPVEDPEDLDFTIQHAKDPHRAPLKSQGSYSRLQIIAPRSTFRELAQLYAVRSNSPYKLDCVLRTVLGYVFIQGFQVRFGSGPDEDLTCHVPPPLFGRRACVRSDRKLHRVECLGAGRPAPLEFSVEELRRALLPLGPRRAGRL